MTATTIKVSSGLRDRLKAQAHAHGRTLGEHLEALVEDEARRDRFAQVRRSMAQSPPDEEYHDEARDWHGEQWN